MKYKAELQPTKFLQFFPETIIQTFFDPDSTTKDAPFFTRYEEATLRKLNDQKYGIYFSVNGFKNRRIKNNLSVLNAVYGDLDVGKDGAQTDDRDPKKRSLWKVLIDGVFPPNIITITKNGLQPIWLLDDAKLSEQETAVNVCCGITDWSKQYGCTGDRVKDVTRVLRLPGYNHHKSSPYLIKSYLLHEERIRLTDLQEAYPFFDEKIIHDDDAAVYKDLRTLDDLGIEDVVKATLSEYGESDARFDEKGRIWISRGVTGAFRLKVGDREAIASTSHEIPAGNKITFVRRLLNLNSNSDAYHWLKERFNLGMNAKKVIVTSLPKLSERKPSRDSDVRYMPDWPILTKTIGGFRQANTYLIGGLEKSGKSSLLASFVNDFIKSGIRCGYLNTELSDDDFCKRMVANSLCIPFDTILQEQVDYWKNTSDELLWHACPPDLSENGVLSFDKTLATAEFMVRSGCKILCFDNLTSFSNASGQKAGWEILGNALSRIVTFSKTSMTTCFVVIHARQDASYVEQPENVNKILKASEPWRIFEESHTIVRKPQLADILSGTAAKSQLSGALLVWRPYQKFEDQKIATLTALVVESFRHAPGSMLIRSKFLGACFKMTESYYQSFEMQTKEAQI